MSPFERTLASLGAMMRLYENDPGFGYRIYKLKDSNDARLFRLPRGIAVAANEEPPPTKGAFIAIADHPLGDGKCIIGYRYFPKEGGEIVTDIALGYDPREINKACKHIVDYLTWGKVPEADGEYADKE